MVYWGGVLGGLLMSAWGGPKRRIRGMSLGWLIFTLFGQVLLGLGRGLAIWIPAVAIAAISFPVSQGGSNAIWQAKPSAACLRAALDASVAETYRRRHAGVTVYQLVPC